MEGHHKAAPGRRPNQDPPLNRERAKRRRLLVFVEQHIVDITKTVKM